MTDSNREKPRKFTDEASGVTYVSTARHSQQRHIPIVRKCCPTCGHAVNVVRYDVELPPLKARIFDLIQKRPGITSDELCALLYESVNEATLVTTRIHISQIRDRLADSGITIFGQKWSGYSIKETRRRK